LATRARGIEEGVDRLLQRRRQLARAADAGAFLQLAPDPRERRFLQLAAHQFVDQAEFPALLARDRVAGHHHVQRALDADQPRQALRAAGAGQNAELHFGQRQERAGRRAPVVAGHRQFQATAHRRAGQRRKDRLGDGVHVGEQVGQRRHAGVIGLAELADVGAAAEVLPGADQQEGLDAWLVLALLDRIEDALGHALVDGERVDRRIVEGDDADGALHLVFDERHSSPWCRFGNAGVGRRRRRDKGCSGYAETGGAVRDGGPAPADGAQTSSHSLRMASFERRSSGVPSNTIWPCPIT
jgi:hypothetical protein